MLYLRENLPLQVSIQVPVFRDENTIDPVEAEKDILKSEDQEDVSKDVPKPWHIYMDAMGFGMGLSCLQITFQACNLEEAETLYDQVCASPLRNILLTSIETLITSVCFVKKVKQRIYFIQIAEIIFSWHRCAQLCWQ